LSALLPKFAYLLNNEVQKNLVEQAKNQEKSKYLTGKLTDFAELIQYYSILISEKPLFNRKLRFFRFLQNCPD